MLGAIGARTRWRRLTTALLAGTLAAIAAAFGTMWGVAAAFSFLTGVDSQPVLPSTPLITIVAAIAVSMATGAGLVTRHPFAARHA